MSHHRPIVLGINCAYHECAAAIVRDGRVVAAVEDERLTRVKHGKQAQIDNPHQLPWKAIEFCLSSAGLANLGEVDAVAYSLMPDARLRTVGVDPYPIPEKNGFGTAEGESEFNRLVRAVPSLIANAGGPRPPRVVFVPHHVAHAASAFYASPFKRAAVLVVDGIGESTTGWLGRGDDEGLTQLGQLDYPHSIGFLWERIAVYLGFGEYDAAKVMGLAAYGDPARFAVAMERLFTVRPGLNGQASLPFRIDPALARFRAGDVAGLESLFGPQRRPDEPPESPRFADVAAALQQRTEDALLAVCRQLAGLTTEPNLAYAGGVALNCVANARIERDGPFRNLYVLGAAHDAGTAQGAALEVSRQFGMPPKRSTESLTPFLGPQYDDAEIASAVRGAGALAERVADPALRAAALIAEGAVVGWFQGRLEMGPRALGHRSLLADPRRAGMRDELNQRIKHREPFRPFAGSILAEAVGDWFQIPSQREGARSARSLMLVTYPVCPARAASIPAVLHCDGTCRLQVVDRDSDPLYHRLLTGFRELTGIPMVLNTSFNDQEPIVCSPSDALATLAQTQIDALFLGDYLVRRNRELA